MAEPSEQQILAALKTVPDPERGGDIVSLGMVQGLVVKGGNVGFTIEVDAARGPRLEPLRKAAEAAVDKVPGVLSVTAVLTAQRGCGDIGLLRRRQPARAVACDAFQYGYHRIAGDAHAHRILLPRMRFHQHRDAVAQQEVAVREARRRHAVLEPRGRVVAHDALVPR